MGGAKNGVVLGAAFSTGGYERLGSLGIPVDGSGTGSNSRVGANSAHFLQGEIGWEHHFEKGLLVGLTVGFAEMLNPESLRCSRSTTRFFEHTELRSVHR